MSSFIDLYKELQNYTEDSIIPWLNEHWKGKDKQESIFRLFASLKLIQKIDNYDICRGNFNNNSIEKITNPKDIFYDKKNKIISLKDKGNSSDLTGINKKDSKNILASTSKNYNKIIRVNDLDIEKILANYKQYEEQGYTLTLCIVVRDNITITNIVKKCEKSNKLLKDYIQKEDTIIIDWNDLDQAFHNFKVVFGKKDITQLSDKKVINFKLHQNLSIIKTLKLKKNNIQSVLWGHIQRSGKSYIMAGCIIEDSKDKNDCNYLIITTAPNETIEQYINVLDCIQLENYNLIYLNGNNLKPELKEKNIIICSKQFLQTKIEKNIKWLKDINFDIRFIDESHNGGTTDLAKKILKTYGNNSFTVYITATYTKPINDYNIPKSNWILWDLEDIRLCKNLNKERLIEKHGEEIDIILKKYTTDNIKEEYSKYPELILLTNEIKKEFVNEIIQNTKDNNYGWSTDACFLLKQNNEEIEFQNNNENLKLWYRIFGKRDKFGIPDSEYPDNLVFIKRIEKICKNPEFNSRFIGDTEEPMIIMAFLPQNDIDNISTATKKLLEKHKVIPDFEIVSINSKNTNNPKQTIEDTRIKAKNNNKKGVLVLSGKQCSLGVSIDNCDIVLLLNTSNSFDMIYQMMFRCMTEDKNKKCGFVVDLNLQRTIENVIIDYGYLIKPEQHPKEASKYILQERLINLNPDHWMYSFGCNKNNINILSDNIYNIYSSNTENALKQFLDRLRFKEIILTKVEQVVFNTLFKVGGNNKEINECIEKLIKEEQIKDGIEKIKVENEEITDEKTKEENEEETKVNYMDILKHIIPLICLLTIHNEETSFVEMFNFIQSNEYCYNILIDQTKSWWGVNLNTNVLKLFINIYIKYVKNDKETNQIIRTIKELFMKNVNNSNELSKLIDKYLIPQEIEKKDNAEVSTPYKLRQEMLDKIPEDFWKEKHTVFEPCSGKGGFLIDIVNRFMKGLPIKDEKERYHVIVEECLYFSDINITNIFICKLLLDPYNEYKLNYNQGNTLEINIKEKWGLKGFDAVIGNPPYNKSGNTATGNTIWQDFTKKSLNMWIKDGGYLLYVHPAGWRKPNTQKGKFYGLFKLMTQDNQMLYLSIHNAKEGISTFKCGTRYDWYLIKKTYIYKNTIINDEYKNEIIIDLKDLEWIPNSNIITIINLIDKKNNLNILCNFNYPRQNKNIVSEIKNDIYKYPLIYLTPKTGVRYMYSKYNDKGHFNIPKIIIGETGIDNAINDYNGSYGMTQDSFGIIINNYNEGEEILDVIKSNKFKNILKSCSWSNFRIDWRLFTYFKKDFWKEFK